MRLATSAAGNQFTVAHGGREHALPYTRVAFDQR